MISEPRAGAVPLTTRMHPPKIVTVSIVGIFLLLLVGAIYYARGFVLPLVLAILISLTFLPLVRWLARRGIPPGVSAALLVLSLGGAVIGTASLIANPVSQTISDAPRIAAALRDRFSFLRQPIEVIVQAGEEVRALADPPNADRPQTVVLAQPGILSWAADTLTGIGTTIGATLILVVFLLSSSDLFLRKIVRAVPSLGEKKLSLRIVYDLQLEVSRYLLTISVINLFFGMVIGATMALLGMPNPVVWGVGAALLNYIPYVGAITGMVLSAAVGLITFPTLWAGLLPPLAYLAFHTLESAFITPLILGRRLELNAVAILVALAFGGWMWGIIGALIAVPLLVVVKVFCDHLPALATFGDFLSAETPVEANGNSEAPPEVSQT
jgi:predicted PurR-regulated permease PerM